MKAINERKVLMKGREGINVLVSKVRGFILQGSIASLKQEIERNCHINRNQSVIEAI